MKKELFAGFIRVHILHHASTEPVYGLWLISELESHGYRLSCGTLYPILHAMEKDGYMASEKKKVEGKIRKYYQITSEGRKALEEAKAKLRELVEEVL